MNLSLFCESINNVMDYHASQVNYHLIAFPSVSSCVARMRKKPTLYASHKLQSKFDFMISKTE